MDIPEKPADFFFCFVLKGSGGGVMSGGRSEVRGGTGRSGGGWGNCGHVAMHEKRIKVF